MIEWTDILYKDSAKVSALLPRVRLHGAKDFTLDHVLNYACHKGWSLITKELVDEYGVDPSSYNNIFAASREGRTDIVSYLLYHTRFVFTPRISDILRIACAFGHLDIVKMCLADPRIDPTWKNNEAVVEACRMDQVEVLRVLLEDPRTDPTDQNGYPLKLALRTEDCNKRSTMSKLLRKRGVDI